jgi:hypothetical protein
MPPEMYDQTANAPRQDAEAHHYRCSITDTVLSQLLAT